MCEIIAVFYSKLFLRFAGIAVLLIDHGYYCHLKIIVTIDVIQDRHSRQPLAHSVNLNTILDDVLFIGTV